MGLWIGLFMVVGGLGVLAVASHVERKSNLERKSEQRGDPPLMRIAFGMILVGVAVMGVTSPSE
jgi:uncharacterized membrane protein YidH (DUF202 family)